MKTINNIYCIGRNYVAHVYELGNIVPDQPVVFSKPTHSLVRANDEMIKLPTNQGEIHFEAELVVKIGEDYTPKCIVDDIVSEITVGLDLTLRDVQSSLKEKSHPWLLSKGFKQSAVLGKFIPFPGIQACNETTFSLYINEEKVQEGNLNKMIFSLETIIHFIGEHLGLKRGDIIFTGTPEGVGPLKNNDHIRLKWGSELLGTATFQL